MKTICPKCSISMEKGFTIDYSHGGGSSKPDWINLKHWHKFWGPKRKEKKKVFSYACMKCGFIENYIDI